MSLLKLSPIAGAKRARVGFGNRNAQRCCTATQASSSDNELLNPVSSPDWVLQPSAQRICLY